MVLELSCGGYEVSEFEEELNKIVVEVVTPIEKYIVEKATSDESLYAQHYEAVLEKFKDWNSPEYIEKEVQANHEKTPVVPAYVAEQIERIKKSKNSYATLGLFDSNYEGKPNYAKWIQKNINDFMVACTVGYTVEKQQLFKLIFPNSTSVLQKNGELNSFADTVYKRYLLDNAMTEQEIKSIDERYWQFAMPVEDGE